MEKIDVEFHNEDYVFSPSEVKDIIGELVFKVNEIIEEINNKRFLHKE